MEEDSGPVFQDTLGFWSRLRSAVSRDCSLLLLPLLVTAVPGAAIQDPLVSTSFPIQNRLFSQPLAKTAGILHSLASSLQKQSSSTLSCEHCFQLRITLSEMVQPPS